MDPLIAYTCPIQVPDGTNDFEVVGGQPARDVIVGDLPGVTLDPSVDGSIPLNRRTGSAMGIDATFPFGADEQKAPDVPAGEACGPAVADHGHEFFKVADVPGWQDYAFSELQKRSRS